MNPIVRIDVGEFNCIVNGIEWSIREIEGRRRFPTKQLPTNYYNNKAIMEALAIKQLIVVNGKHPEEVEEWIKEIKLLLTNGDEIDKKLPRDPCYQGEFAWAMKWLESFRCYEKDMPFHMPFTIEPRSSKRSVSI